MSDLIEHGWQGQRLHLGEKPEFGGEGTAGLLVHILDGQRKLGAEMGAHKVDIKGRWRDYHLCINECVLSIECAPTSRALALH